MGKKKNKKSDKESFSETILVELSDDYGYTVKQQILTDLEVARELVERFVKTKSANSGRIQRFNTNGQEAGKAMVFKPTKQTVFKWEESSVALYDS